jgi:small multidrug resistance family-3 protein
MQNISLYVVAAILEIGGCYAFWMWLKLNRTPLWAGVGVIALVSFAWVLTRIEMSFAGRAYAAYGGIYVVATLVWMWLVEGARPDRWALVGGAVCLMGCAIIVFSPKSA